MKDSELIAIARLIDAELTAAPWFACVNDLIGGCCIQTVDLPAAQAPPGSAVADMVLRDSDAFLITQLRNIIGEILRRWGSDARQLHHWEQIAGEVARLLRIDNGDDEAILPRLRAVIAERDAAQRLYQGTKRIEAQ